MTLVTYPPFYGNYIIYLLLNPLILSLNLSSNVFIFFQFGAIESFGLDFVKFA